MSPDFATTTRVGENDKAKFGSLIIVANAC